MSEHERRRSDGDRVKRATLEHLKIHIRVAEQGLAPGPADLATLADQIPQLSAFRDHEFAAVRAILDWDHQIPSEFVLLRILACYDDATAERVDAVIEDRDQEIADGNLYPEFDVPDYSEIEGSETYVGVIRPGATTFEDFRFLSAWRKQVPAADAELAAKIVRGDARYKKAAKSRMAEGLGGPVVIGWAPPCMAETDHWAIEIWLLTEFDGHIGKARVFMVDTVAGAVTRDFETDVQLA